ncbi:hypothetical protein FGK63_05785 [Ruegeria sediminis]|uniref:Uncharacterized protein n=1 Tax=Ruegeria sediminis TaxID=2583820 RepID=A0ABY2X069_9RHOB|nr:hypothetical protein [Ruegeria sediminis]TMV08631.1 hypothetical protein FGK63_05785 [Ruegeria sediminis]
MKRLMICMTAALFGTAALASGPGESHKGGTAYLGNGAFTYEIFETAVEHADLEGCPAEFDPEAVFCRLTVAADMAHVFVFSYNGDQPLLAVKGYELGDGFLPF